MPYAKDIFLSLLLIFTSSCTDTNDKSEGDFYLSCLRWDDSVVVCEDYIETDPLTGYVKIWHFKDDPYYDTNLFLCGANLELNTKHPLQDYVAAKATSDELLCSDAEKDNIEWAWKTDTCLEIIWDNLYLGLEIPECSYNDKVCAILGTGYISLE